MSGFCTHCGHKVPSFEGLKACPRCKSTGVPCDDKAQVTVSINWHELRILTIWSERYGPDKPLVHAIAHRLEDQHPEMTRRMPLTFAGEIAQIQVVGGLEVQHVNIKDELLKLCLPHVPAELQEKIKKIT